MLKFILNNYAYSIVRLIFLCFIILFTFLFLIQCSNNKPDVVYPDAGDDTSLEDDNPIGGCKYDNECDDGIACTDDICNKSLGLCDHEPNDQLCSDKISCNGSEKCDINSGCIAGEPYQLCNDSDPCTIDICSEPPEGELLPICDHILIDRDNDQHVDIHCDDYQGDDCNDLDPQINPDSQEKCFDEIDNDCDNSIDLNDPDCSEFGDKCEDAVVLIPGQTREGFNSMASADIETSCGISSEPDTVYSFTITQNREVDIRVWGSDDLMPTLSLQKNCNNVESEVTCIRQDSARLYFASLEAGTYYLIIKTNSQSPFQILLTTDEQQPPEDGDTCNNPLELEERIVNSFWDFADDMKLSCADSDNLNDVVYHFAIQENQDIHLEINSFGSWGNVELRKGSCDDNFESLLCTSGNNIIRNFGNLAPDDYYLIIEGQASSYHQVIFETSPATSVPENDNCSNPLQISTNDIYEGSLLSSQRNYSSRCNAEPQYDIVYSFDLIQDSDVVINLSGEDELNPMGILIKDCNFLDQAFCFTSLTGPQRYYNIKSGTYFLIVSGEYQADFVFELLSYSATQQCSDSQEITGPGSYQGETEYNGDNFEGSCGGFMSSDTVFVVNIAQQTRFIAEIVQANFSSLLYLRSECNGNEIVCDRNSGSSSLPKLDIEELEAGTYYLIVDGTSPYYSGDFALNIDY